MDQVSALPTQDEILNLSINSDTADVANMPAEQALFAKCAPAGEKHWLPQASTPGVRMPGASVAKCPRTTIAATGKKSMRQICQADAKHPSDWSSMNAS